MKSFQTVYAVPLECSACVESLTDVLTPLGGVEAVEVSLSAQQVIVTGTCAPSTIVSTIRASGRDAVIRGTGEPNSAAVCILETFENEPFPVKGLARIVSAGGDCMLDLTLNGLERGAYRVSIRASGDISRGVESTGGVYYQLPEVEVTTASSEASTIASLGAETLAKECYSGHAFVKIDLSVGELIGRSITVERASSEASPNATSPFAGLAGVIARSAGIWENDKAVCSCSGKTVWEERKEALGKGMV